MEVSPWSVPRNLAHPPQHRQRATSTAKIALSNTFKRTTDVGMVWGMVWGMVPGHGLGHGLGHDNLRLAFTSVAGFQHNRFRAGSVVGQRRHR